MVDNISNLEIEYNDQINYMMGLWINSFLEMNNLIKIHKLNNSEELVLLINKCYEDINSEELKKELLPHISSTVQKYLNLDKYIDKMTLEESYDKCKEIFNLGISVSKGITNVKNKSKFDLELSDLIKEKKINSKDEKILNKIYEYDSFSKYIIKEYMDTSTYNYIKKKCDNFCNLLNNKESKAFIDKYIE